jgi:hypothetical protein
LEGGTHIQFNEDPEPFATFGYRDPLLVLGQETPKNKRMKEVESGLMTGFAKENNETSSTDPGSLVNQQKMR